MLNFNFYSPTFFVFGKGTQHQAGELVKKFGGTRVLLHYGGGSIVKSGLYDEVCKSLDKENIFHTSLGGVRPNPVDSLVYKGIDVCKKEKIDFILAVGGGSTIDSAKGIAAGVKYDGDFWDFYEGNQITDALPIGTVLTIPAAGSEGSPNSVITAEKGLLKRGAASDVLRPKFSVLNPELAATLPKHQVAYGITDIMAHVIERYFSPTTEVGITDKLCEAILTAVIQYARRALDNPGDYEAMANIMWAGTLAHNNVCGVGRVQDWGSHRLEHELSALYDCAHGAGLAVIIPAWMKYIMDADINRFAAFANRIWNVEIDRSNLETAAAEGISRLKEFFKSLGMPTSFDEIGAKKEDIPLLASKVAYDEGGLGGIKPLFRDDFEKVYHLAAE